MGQHRGVQSGALSAVGAGTGRVSGEAVGGDRGIQCAGPNGWTIPEVRAGCWLCVDW